MRNKTGPWRALYEALASVKLSVFLFLILALCSIVGTLLPQGLTGEEVHRHFRPLVAWWIETLSLHDLYHSGWFQVLMLLLCVNLLVCSLRRLPKTLKLFRTRGDSMDPAKLTKFGFHFQLTTKLPWSEIEPRLEKIIAEELAPLRPVQTPTGFAAIAEKGRWSPFMAYGIHLSVLFVLGGALIGSFFGFKGVMNIPEGESSEEVLLYQRHQSLLLPFQVRCDDFDVSFYDTGAPREYRSDLVVLDDGREVLRRSIRVNEPLTYRGVTFYQSSYGLVLKSADVELTDKESGETIALRLPYREMVKIPGTQDRIEAVQFQENFGRFGPAIGIVLLREGQQEPMGSWILVKMPEFHGNRLQNYQVKIIKTEEGYYTGLQVKRDPGVWIVYAGFILLLAGVGMTFYSRHRKLWIWADTTGSESSCTRILIAGRTNKNTLTFEEEFNHLADRLRQELTAGQRKEESTR
ncbi:MAG: cytochrome c biogenesis protein ResB [Syntrophobacteraceae bacterium]|nr:cytochrome c biogenesis protein ResB [Syntrophobacteraceae bacterium]